MPTICIVGLGYIGLPTAVIFASHGFKVTGVDLDESKVSAINKGKSYITEPELENELKFVIENKTFSAQLKPTFADVFIIAVPTPHIKEKNFYYPDISNVFEAIENICPYLKENNLIIIESTSPIGTTEKISKLIYKKTNFNEQQIDVTYCPERVLPGNIINELKNNDRVIGGVTEKASTKAKRLYSQICNSDLFITNSRTAEMTKLSENAFRDVNIALANELSVICDEIDIDINQLINLTNRHPRVNILNPGCGVGGHCIAVDPWFIVSGDELSTRLIQKSRQVNKYKTKWVIEKIESFLESILLKKDTPLKIGFLGLTYKPNISDLRESPALEIANYFFSSKYQTFICEPNITKLKKFNILSLDEIINHVDLIVKLVDHKEFKNFDFKEKIFLDFT